MRTMVAFMQVNKDGANGRAPSDFLDTRTGAKVIERLLGAMLSGAYQ